MSSKPDYAAEEWQLLLDIPPLVGAAVMMAGRSGLGTMKEAFAIAKGVMDGRHGFEDNELIQSLITARLEDKDRSEIEKLGGEYKGKTPEALLELTVSKCGQLIELLQAKSTPEESVGYKQWAMSVGEKVANAAKEGGFLGIGGERVSEHERRVLSDVATALQV